MPPKTPNDQPTLEQLQTQISDLTRQNDLLKNMQTDLEQQLIEAHENLARKLPADFEKKLTAFFNGPAHRMNSLEQARAIIQMLSA